MTLAAEPGLVDGAIVPDAGDDILKNAARRDMEENVVGDDSRHSRLQSHVRQFVQPERVVRSPPQRQRHIGPVAETPRRAGEDARRRCRPPRPGQGPRSGPRRRRRDRTNRDGTAPCRRASCPATAIGTAAHRRAGRSDRRERTCRRRDRVGSRRSVARPSSSPLHARGRCRRANRGRRSPAPRCPGRRPARTIPRRNSPRAKTRNARCIAARHSARRSSEDPVHEPPL